MTLLASLPTTLEEDLALLGEGVGPLGRRQGGAAGAADWRDRVLLQLRVARKRALRRAVALLDDALDGVAEF